MKKLKSTIPDGGAPLGAFPVLRELFDEETKTAIEALLYSVAEGETEGFVLKGCAVTGIVSDYDIAEGYIYVDGEVLYYAGSEGNSTPVYLKKDTVTEESGVFADGASKAYIDVNTATEYTTTGGGAGTQYISFDFDVSGQTISRLVSGSEYIDSSSVVTEVKLKTKIIEIGDWDMDADEQVNITHGLTASTILDVKCVIIRDDSASTRILSAGLNANDTTQKGFVGTIGSTTFSLLRETGGLFDSTDYDSTSFNRGKVIITYED